MGNLQTGWEESRLTSEDSFQRKGTVGYWKGKFRSVSGPVCLN